MGIVQFLKECYNTEMYTEDENLKKVGGKYLGIIFDFFAILPLYFAYLILGYLMIQTIVKIFFSSSELLSSQWFWLFYGILFGLFVSVILQGIPKHGETPKKILGILFHHLIFLSAFLIATFFWIFMIVIFGHFFGFI